jgi:1-aminocyclopropane-1-carboxylate deaminase/D-cysteine desulfhydrase-like pyridoxal-dependent ACC family enzyme
LGYNTKGYILPQKTQSEVLQQCQNLGMQLSSLPYQEYKKYLQEKPSTLPPNEYFIPFGGSGELANIGLAQLAQQFNNLRLSTTMPLYLCAGTGTTALGLRPMLQNKMHIFMPFHKPLQSIISLFTNHTNCVFEIDNTKFGKVSPQIIEFCNYIYKTNSLQLDVVYTARLLQLIFNKINTYQIKSDVIMLHTGGLSGNLPHNTLLKY